MKITPNHKTNSITISHNDTKITLSQSEAKALAKLISFQIPIASGSQRIVLRETNSNHVPMMALEAFKMAYKSLSEPAVGVFDISITPAGMVDPD